MKQLQPYVPAAQAVYARIKVKAVKEGALYTKYEHELKSMTEGFGSFIINVTVAVAGADDINAVAALAEQMKTLKVKLEGLTTNTDHHLGGANGNQHQVFQHLRGDGTKLFGRNVLLQDITFKI